MLNRLLSRTLRVFAMGVFMLGLAGCEMTPGGDNGNDGGNNGGNDGGNNNGGNDGGDNGSNGGGGDANGGDNNDDGNNNDNGGDTGEIELTTVTFEAATGFPEDDTEVTFDVDGREINFTGGFAIRRGIPALYGEGVRSWMINSTEGSGRIDLAGLNVVKARFFWGRLEGDEPARMTFTDSNGDTSDSIEAIAVPVNDAMVEVEAPNGATIERMDFGFADGVADNVESALDSLTLTVTE